MGRGESPGLILWTGSARALTYRLLETGSEVPVESIGDIGEAASPQDQLSSLQALIARRPPECLGVALPPGLTALRGAAGADGLAKAVGWSDSLAFAGGLPGAFAFLAKVGGMVAAIRETTGERYCDLPARIETNGPVAWAALAALTQLRTSGVSAAPDAMTGAVAHRLGVELARSRPPGAELSPGDQAGVAGILFDSEGFHIDWSAAGDEPDGGARSALVGADLVELHTVAAQVRLFTSREPNMEAMREVLREARA